MSYFIAFDGIDGSGTTSQAKRLVENLNNAGKKAIFTFEPSDGEIGKFIRNLFTRDEPMPNWETMALLFSADRMHHVDTVIRPAMEKGIIVVTDRYYYSTLGYQTYFAGLADPTWNEDTKKTARTLANYWVKNLNQHAFKPDFTFILDVYVEIAQNRLGARGKPDQFEEKKDLQTYLADYYKDLYNYNALNGETIIHIDGHQSKEKVEEDILNHTKKYINLSEGAVI